ncbi:receptor-type tyrosine-protein phosphatase kappa-like [Mercenaria mercenaria]|uniref:receptor-type tyrosine-protein phosphatase kappa-like n=1 Tax=Mercenaria mercenaria TaxID=6596 RepID=UPI00234F62F5|nr:receptor-type tyrosine-protein phosphatase kappa-like [Mercenaria mercenaria]
MAWEQKSSFIIMLTEIPEEGLSRCEKYWPDLDKHETFGDITITCYDCNQYADYTVRLLKLSLKNGHEREIVHLQFTAWPEEGCPVSAIDFIQFHQKYRTLTKGRHGMGATIVHCTAGVGRTGVFIALDILVEEGLDTLNVDVFKCVVALREQRVDMVRSIDQYEFLYKAVAQTFALEAQPCHKVRLQDKLTELKRFDHDSGKSKLELLYQSLKASLVLDTAEIATVDVLQERKSKDRPTSDVPDVLFRPDLPQNIYINAVIFESLRKKEAIVATQMPTPDTLQDFCQLLVYHQCATVIMLNPIDPNDKSIGTYWPTAKTPVVAGKMIISQLSIEKESDYIIRQLRIHTPETDDDSPAHEVTMIQYKGWKIVKNVPNAKNMLKILQVCQRYIRDLPDKRLLIHCMNGAEQSGLFCALVNLLEIVDFEDEVSVTSVVRKILARRPNALPTMDQFEMCFAATCEYIKKA